MVTDYDEIKLVDFDIARIFRAKGTMNTNIGYPVPEQLQGRAEPRSDVYALGATLYRALTHYDIAKNTPNVVTFPSLRTLRPDISPEFEQVVMKALEPKLEKRWASATEMERAMLNLPPITSATNIKQVPGQQPWPQEGTGPASSFISSAQAYITAHNLEDALTAIQQASALEPNNAVVHKIFGQIFALRQPPNIDNALQAYNRSLELNPNDAETHKLLGNAWFIVLKQPTPAIENYRESLRLKTDDAEAHWRLGQCYQRTNQLDAALSEYQQSLSYARQNGELHIQGRVLVALAQLRHQAGDYATANQLLEDALTIIDTSHDHEGAVSAYYVLANFLEERGEVQQSLKAIKKAYEHQESYKRQLQGKGDSG